jgi:hypothetical protein
VAVSSHRHLKKYYFTAKTDYDYGTKHEIPNSMLVFGAMLIFGLNIDLKQGFGLDVAHSVRGNINNLSKSDILIFGGVLSFGL